MKKTLLTLGIILLLFLSFIPRSAEVLSGNYLFGFDQGRDYLAVKNIVTERKITLIGSEIGAGYAGFQGIFHGPFHYYFLAVLFALFNGDPYGGIVLTFIYGMATILLGFVLGRKLFGLYGGMLTALLIAISPPLISGSRFVWNTHGAPVFILLSFYFLYSVAKEKGTRKRNIFLTAFFAGFVYNFQLAIAIPLCLGFLLSFMVVMRFRHLLQYAMALLGFGTAFAPMLFFEARHGFPALKGLLTYIFIKDSNIVTTKFIEVNIKDHFGLFLYNFFDTFPRIAIVQNMYFLVLFFMLVIYFLVRKSKSELRSFFYALLFLPLVSFLVLSFIKGAIYVYYLTHLYLVYIILFVYIIFASYKYRLQLVSFGFVVILAVMVFYSIMRNTAIFIYDYNDYGGDAKIKGKIDALDYIYKDAKDERFNLLVFSPPIYIYPYDYLVWWYGGRKYHYIPPKEKKGTFYLWIEVDSSKPWSYKGWLDTVIKAGEPVKTVQLPSGFIVKKYIRK